MLSNETIQSNKEEFLNLVRKIKREGADIDKLINKLENSDFFTAPASTKYHSNYTGGLCAHSLNVYYELLKLTDRLGLQPVCYDESTLIIVALFHDISKMNIYTQDIKNKKVYCSDGDKYDNLGNFKWVSVPGWKVKEDKFLYGNHEMTSEYIIRQFIPLTLDESVAILHHMGSLSSDSAKDDIPKIFGNYQLSILLHLADMMATYVVESCDE